MQSDFSFKNGLFRPLFGLFSSFLQFSQQLTVNMFVVKFCSWLDSNRGPLVLEATTLPTKPQSSDLYFWKA